MTFLKLIRRKFCPHFLMGRGRFFLRFDLSEILASNVERQKERKTNRTNKQNESRVRHKLSKSKSNIRKTERKKEASRKEKKHYRNLKKSEQQFS